MMSAGGDAPHRGTSREVPIEELVEGWDQLPLHKQELYRMFGADEAECFLHPKMQPEKKNVVQVPSSLRKLGGMQYIQPASIPLMNSSMQSAVILVYSIFCCW